MLRNRQSSQETDTAELTPKSFSISFAEVALLTGPAINDLDFGTSVENWPSFIDPTLVIIAPKEELGTDEKPVVPLKPYWRLFERGLGDMRSRP